MGGGFFSPSHECVVAPPGLGPCRAGRGGKASTSALAALVTLATLIRAMTVDI